MSDKIPRIDPDLQDAQKGHQARMAELEYEALSAEAKLQKLAHREIGQRVWVKWAAVTTGVATIIGMACLLAYVVAHFFNAPFILASPSFAALIVIAPIVSITSITVALLIGAFRKFEEKDLDAVGKGIASASDYFRSG